ncbi:fatty-acid--CoA ligase FadD8 [Aeromicrobium sp. CTD01-1L150]|uniref:fatty-acid--CoA ligase FadD8 n=1 Tax=Aeromicrobium sp. CTD01-1L150 TaxID=3341830 RepID=UPI0035BF2088
MSAPSGPAVTGDMYRGPHSGEMLLHSLRRHAAAPVMQLGERTITGREMVDEMSRYVRALEDLGAGTGTAVGLLAANRPEVLFLIGAGQTQGYRRTALHPLGSLDDHAYVLDDAGVSALIVDNVPSFLERADALQQQVPSLQTVITIDDLAAKAATYDPEPLVAKELAPDHVVGITYTGGTTGQPKGVIGTAASIAAMTQVQLAEWEWPETPAFLLCTPLSHAGAAFFAPTVAKGGRLVVLPGFDPETVLRTIEEQRITATMLVPSMLYALMDHPDSRTRDLSSLETIYYGASAINPTRLAEAIERFGPIFAQYFGQSECPMVISYLAKADHTPQRLGSCGRPSAFLRTALLGEDGEPVAPGEPGEICVAGPVLASGYWNKPEETAEAFHGGWLHTGDVAREDEDGFWYIVDRVKDMIVTGGFNVFPREVEDVVAEHPAVAQVGVIGTPHEKFGEAVTAVVVLRADVDHGEESIDRLTVEIQASVKAKKGSVHSPKQVVVRDSLPLTPLGKPDKKALRAQFWSGDRSVG